jgi:S-adenosylmethionine decarboxylase proenzyme
MVTLGTHLLLELKGSDPVQLDDLELLQKTMLEAAAHAGATTLHHGFRRFKPNGVSGVVIIEESHLSIHTWPEQRYAAIDVFTCGDRATPHMAVDYIRSKLLHTSHTILEIGRGAVEEPKKEPLVSES